MAKRFIILSCYLLFVLVSVQCQSGITGSIKGEGEIVKQEITLEAIHGVNLGFSGDVILTQGNTQKIVMEGQQNILDNIRREVKSGVWNVYFDKSIREMKNVTVHITLPNLDEVRLSGSGSIRSTNKFTGADDMEIRVSGSGGITLDYTANSTDLALSGSGEINLSGESKELSIAVSGSGDIVAGNLKTDNCDIHISGSGDATVNVNNSLETHISGSGDVRYSGSPSVEARISGSGDVSKIN